MSYEALIELLQVQYTCAAGPEAAEAETAAAKAEIRFLELV